MVYKASGDRRGFLTVSLSESPQLSAIDNNDEYVCSENSLLQLVHRNNVINCIRISLVAVAQLTALSL